MADETPPDVEPTLEANEAEQAPAKSNEEILSEMFAGRWGRGLQRRLRLAEAGYDVKTLEEEYRKVITRT
jgi:hypothetical protein